MIKKINKKNKKYKSSVLFAIVFVFVLVSFFVTHSTAFALISMPTANTSGASSIGVTSAVLGGSITIYSGQSLTQEGFQWGLTTSYTMGSEMVSVSYTGGSFGASYLYSYTLTGLSCGTTYHYRAMGTTSMNSPIGSDSSFTTLSCTPTVHTLAATSIGLTTATLNGSAYAGSGNITGATFSYSSTSTLTVSSSFPYSPGTTNTYSYNVTGLSCGTTYNYTTFGTSSTLGALNDSSGGVAFTTLTCPTAPTVSTTGSSAVTDSSAVLTGSLNTVGSYSSTASVAGFQYGLDTTYGSTASNAGSFYAGTFTKSLSSLSCSTTYHYRAFATNYNSGYGTDKTFTTGACTGSSGNVSGYAWSSNIGWISLDCAHGGAGGSNICGTSSYSVNVTPNTVTQKGLFSGYAWNSGVGWISFNPYDLTSCGAGPSTQAQVDLSNGSSTSGYISGWAKALSFGSSSYGCIDLRGTVAGSSTTYGVIYNSATSTSNLSGTTGHTSYAWGGDTIGWISWPTADLNLSAPTLAMTVNGSTSTSFTSAGGTASLVWTATNMMASNCTASSSDGSWSGPVSSGGGSQLLTLAPNTTTSTITKTYTLGSCTSISGVAVTPVSVTVTIAAASATSPVLIFKANGSGDTTPLIISSGDPVTLEWQVENIAGGSCTGTSTSAGGAISGWNSTAKAPLSGVASTSTSITYDEIINPPATSTRAYTINCGTIAKTVNITVATSTTPVTTPSISFTINGATSTTFASTGGSATLQWITSGLDSSDCTASSSDSSWSGTASYLGGTQSLTIAANTSTTTQTIAYTLSNCLNNGNVMPVQTVYISIAGTTAPYLAFTANGESATTIDSGANVTLAWQLANVTGSCTGTSSGTGSPYTYWTGGTKPPTASLTPNESFDGTSYYETIGADGSITSDRTYTLTCGSLSSTVTINVNPSTGPSGVNLNLSDDSFPSTGGTSTLAWVTNGLDTTDCTANSSASDWTGTASYLGGTFAITIPNNTSTSTITRTYTISNCMAAGVTLPSQTVSLTVAGASTPYLSLIASNGTVSGTDITVVPTDTVTLSWQMQNISSGTCHGTSDGSYSGWANTLKHPLAIDGSVGSTPVTYTESVGSSTSTRAYSITCTGTSGAVVYDTATITVNNTTSSGCVGDCYRDTSSMSLAVNGDPSIVLPPTATSATLIWSGLHLDTTGCVATSNPSSGWTGPQSAVGGSYAVSFTPTTATSATPHTYTISGCMSSVDDTIVPPVTVTVTIAPASTPSLISFLVDGSSSATIDAGTPVTLSWQVQNIGTGSYCHGTSSSGAVSGWNGDAKNPTTSMTTAQTYYNYNVGGDGSITSTQTFTLNCGTAGTQSVMVTVNPIVVVTPPCVGFSCSSTSGGGGSITPPSLKIFKLPPWLEI